MKKIIPTEPDWEKVVRWMNEEIDTLYYIAKNKRRKIKGVDISEELLKMGDLIRTREFLFKKKLIDRL